MDLDQVHRDEVVERFRIHEKDTQSTDVQVAILTERIGLVQDQLDRAPSDRRLRLLLLQLVGKRRRLLSYLALTNYSRYLSVADRLGV